MMEDEGIHEPRCHGHAEVWTLGVHGELIQEELPLSINDYPENCFEIHPAQNYRVKMSLCHKPSSEKMRVTAGFVDLTGTGCGNHQREAGTRYRCEPDVIMRFAAPLEDGLKPAWKCMTYHKEIESETNVLELDLCFNKRQPGCTSQGLMKLDLVGISEKNSFGIQVCFKVM